MIIELKSTDLNEKNEIITFIAQGVADYFNSDPLEIKQGFEAREAILSTGMVNGIAVPHTKANINEPMLYITKVGETKNWETLDTLPVELVIAILVPIESDEHLKILANVSRKLMDDDNVALLKQASSRLEVANVLGL